MDKLPSSHPMDLELECYCLGIPMDESRLEALEEHLLACPSCVERAKAAEGYVEVMRAGLRKLGEG
jgi:hypothetical protein